MISQFVISQVVLYTIDAMDNIKSKSHTVFVDDNAVVSHGQNIDVVSDIVIVIKLKKEIITDRCPKWNMEISSDGFPTTEYINTQADNEYQMQSYKTDSTQEVSCYNSRRNSWF